MKLPDKLTEVPRSGYASLTNDYMFKRIFGSECKDILITFLNRIVGNVEI